MKQISLIEAVLVVSAGACASDAERCIKGDDVALCERACAGGDANACLKLGAMHAARSEPSLSAFRRACALGMQEGCDRLKLVSGSGGLANCDRIADKIVARLNAYLPGDPEARKQAEARHAAVRASTIKRCIDAKYGKAIEDCVEKASGLNAINRCLAAAR